MCFGTVNEIYCALVISRVVIGMLSSAHWQQASKRTVLPRHIEYSEEMIGITLLRLEVT